DYVTKPFDLEELHARIRALLRRGQASEASKLSYGDLHVDLLARKVERAGQQIKLSPKEFALLEYLVRNPDRPLSRSSIARKVWDIDHDASSNLIDVYISALRKKVDKGFAQSLIHTVIGVGYRFGSSAP
ncbi:MAG: response regulator transcription factor, partial [Myxococcales bacterium]|nr:response regulator transcription factor [Myxococcales bacterium]